MNYSQPIIIFTTERPNMDERERQEALYEAELIFPRATKAVGMYEGDKEECFIVPYTEDNELRVRRLCKAFKQHSYLKTDMNGHAALYNEQGTIIKKLGRLVEATISEANYTKIGNIYYISTGDN